MSIRICIRSFLKIRVVFVFVFGHQNTIRSPLIVYLENLPHTLPFNKEFECMLCVHECFHSTCFESIHVHVIDLFVEQEFAQKNIFTKDEKYLSKC